MCIKTRLNKETSLGSKKILVVDDHTDSLETLTFLLKMTGFSVALAENGQAALRVLETYEPELIITDINMPYLNGIELTKWLRKHSHFKDTPVIVLTAHQNLSQLTLEAGANEILIKPIDFDELVAAINRLLAL